VEDLLGEESEFAIRSNNPNRLVILSTVLLYFTA